MLGEQTQQRKWEVRRGKPLRRLENKSSERQLKLQRLLEEEQFSELEY